MEYKKFEDHIKNTFLAEEEAVDVSKIMAAVDDANKKNKKGLYITLGLLLMLCTASASIYIIYTDDDYSSKMLLNSSNIEETAEILNENGVEKETVQSTNRSINTYDSKLNESLNNSSTESKGLKLNSSNSPFISTEKAIIYEPFVKNDITFSESNTFIPENSKSIIKDKSKETIHSDDKEFINNVTFVKLDQQNQESAHTLLGKLFIENLNKSTSLSAFVGNPQRVECPSFNKNPWIFEIGTIMGVSDPVKRFSINPQEINPALTSRAENEKSLEGLDLEFYLSAKRMRWPVFVKGGFAYSRWTEQMNIDRNYTEIDTVQGIVSATVSQTGDTITYIYGDIFIEKDIQIKRKVHYYINRVNIPISLIFEKEFGGNNAIQAELGASFNIQTFSAGSVYEAENTFTPVNIGGFFNTLTGVSYFTKLHYRRYLNENFFVGALAHFHYLPAEFSNQTSFSQKYHNYGVGLYAGYRF